MNTARMEALKQQIEDAFSDVPYPGDARIIDNPGDSEEWALARAFRGRRWKDLTREDLHLHSSNFLSDAGFHYYLPAYLVGALDEYMDLLPFMVHDLRRVTGEDPDAVEIRELRQKQSGWFNQAQRRAIRAFLEYARDECSHYFTESSRREITASIQELWSDEIRR